MKSSPLLLLLFILLIPLPAVGQAATAYSVVAGSGANKEAVDKITSKVISAGLSASTIDFSDGKKSLFRTCSGYFTKQQDAIKHKTQLIGLTGIRDAWILNITSDILGLFPGSDSVTEEVPVKTEEVKTKNPPAKDKESKNPPAKDKESKNPPAKDKESKNPPAKDEEAKNPPAKDKESKNPQKEPVSVPPGDLNSDNLSAADIDEVIRIYKEIVVSLGKNNTDPIEKYIDPELGIIEIIDPEGIPYPIYSSSLKQAVMQGLFISTSKGDPVKDYLPEFDCNLGMWTKTGSFISKVKKYSRLTSILKDAEEVVYIDKILLNAIEKMEYRISIIIISTDETQLGFLKKEGSLYLGVVDNSFDCVE
ncbi:MAG: hypothetical protein IPJ75_05260 [Ignavibacteriales bacterium]|nr:hypothetical protein [Ignavibacteriales bacterium]